MNIELLLTAAGAMLTLVFGTWAVLLALSRVPGKIAFLEERCIGLFDDIVRKLPELSIAYKGKPIGQNLNLVMLTGFLLNSGKGDIARRLVSVPLTACLPEGYRWLTARIDSASHGVTPEWKILNDIKLQFSFEMLRRTESLHFEALAEVPMPSKSADQAEVSAGRRLRQALRWEHRIENTRKVREKKFPPAKLDWSEIIPVIVLVATGAYLVYSMTLAAPAEVHYSIDDGTGKQVYVRVKSNMDNTITLEGVDSNYERTIPLHEFEPDLAKAKIARRNLLAVTALAATVFTGITIFAFFYVVHLFRSRKLVKILAATTRVDGAD